MNPSIAQHLITTLKAHGVTAEVTHSSITYGVTDTFSMVSAPTATGMLHIIGATCHGEDSDDYVPTYDVDYPATEHGAYLAEHEDRSGKFTVIYESEGQRLSLADDTAALTAAVLPLLAAAASALPG
ncbi:hypothetical protein ACODT3_42210 [Streptomyces sp. 4.24]|uniref:hypothetical protein n=1 Tax=Streptomyces tritrimontium TaxID=3406573 RepID=UPI003BB6515A